MKKRYNDISGAILAGGRNSRMGSPKYFLKVKGKRIIDSALDVLNELFPEILIITDDRTRFSDIKRAKIVEDAIKGLGPVGGIYTGLGHASREEVFFVAGDMPFLHSALIRRLIERARDRDYDCVIPRSPRGAEPLYGFYSKRMLPLVEAFLKEGKRSAHGLLERCKCVYVEAASDELSAFVNVNTPGEMKEISVP